jgi:hypothetical protein
LACPFPPAYVPTGKRQRPQTRRMTMLGVVFSLLGIVFSIIGLVLFNNTFSTG